MSTLAASVSGRSIAQVARDLGMAPGTIWRWIQYGILTPSGERAILKATRWPNGWKIDPTDFEAFVVALNTKQADSPAPVANQSRGQTASLRANAALEARGW